MESAYNQYLRFIYVLIFLFALANSLVTIAVPLFAYSLGASQLEIGILGLTYVGIQIPLSVFFGRLSDKAGRLKLLVLSLLCYSLSLTLLTVSDSLLLLYFVRAIGGFAASIFWPVTGAMCADRAPSGKMVKVMGLSNVSWGISSVIGPTVSGYLIDHFQNFTATFLAGAIATLATYPIIIYMSRISRKDKGVSQQSYEKPSVTEAPGATQGNRSVLAWSFTAVAFYGVISGVIWNMFPVYSVIIGFSKTVTGLFSTIANVMSIILFLGIGRLSERFTKLNLCVLGAAFCTLVILVPLARSFVPIAFSIAMVGLGTAIIHPTSRAAVLELSSAKRGSYIGIYESIVTSGMSAGSFLGGALAGYVALEAPYYFSSAMAVAVFLFLIFFARRKNSNA
jgi:MFS family permease